MSTDEELFAQMKLQEESPDDPRHRRVAKPKYATSEFTAEELKAHFGERVWVRCVTELQPWADDKPLHYWKQYHIKVEDAIILDERRFAVILMPKTIAKKVEADSDDQPENVKLTSNKRR